MQRSIQILILPALALAAPFAVAGGDQAPATTLDPVTVGASANRLSGVADSANQGTVTAAQLENRPLLRTGELLEAVPGVLVTQHSGDGKANQYFSRGFNLDHGTDFRTTVLGMPVNMPTHAHGQGYSDLNFVIPELVRTIQYKKGTYYAEEGDFSAAGAAAFDYVRSMDQGLLSLDVGANRYQRVALANSLATGPGSLLYAVENLSQDGPWKNPENFKRLNAVLSYSWKSDSDSVRVTGMAMQSSWNATDQIPQRAVIAGQLDPYDAVDASDGGDTQRWSLSADWTRDLKDGGIKANSYWIGSRLNLFSNFTYALDNPVVGDQFHQAEQRQTAGLNLERYWPHALGPWESESRLGLQWRKDWLSPVGLYTTQARQRFDSVREDQVQETTAALYASNTTRWTPWFRTAAGLRSDAYAFDVRSSLAANSGNSTASVTSPKLSAILTPDERLEVYLNWGRGFHSNDARGVTQTLDPKTGLPVDANGDPIVRATPLVRALGQEVGLRLSGLLPGLQTSVSLWDLRLESELVFVGDAGTTEIGRPSYRKGLEIANYYVPAPGWIVDVDLAWSQARFTDIDGAGPFVPGAVDRTASVGVSGSVGKWSGGLRWRYIGPRALVEDDAVRSQASSLFNAKLSYALRKDVKLSLEVLNLLDNRVSDIDYYYASQLRGEPAPVEDIHTHPAEPRTLRVGVVMKF